MSQPDKNYNPRWNLSIGREDRTEICLRAHRHIAMESYSGDVWCLVVPTGAYVTRRNGKTAITGNSAHWHNASDAIIIVHLLDREKGRSEVEVAKSRYPDQIGRVGSVFVNWDRAQYRFRFPNESEPEMGMDDNP